MKNTINENIEKLEVEYKNATQALRNVQEQIQIYKKKAEELVAHLNYTKGAIDILKDISSDKNNEVK